MKMTTKIATVTVQCPELPALASGDWLGCVELQKTAETITRCLDNWGMLNNKFTLDNVTHVIKKQLEIMKNEN
jgi:hypothetical protein